MGLSLTENPQLEDLIGIGLTGSDGTCTLQEFDEQRQPTGVEVDVEYGTYYIVGYTDDLMGIEQVTVSANSKNFNITLLSQFSTVTIICQDSQGNRLSGTWVGVDEDQWSGNTDENGELILTDVHKGEHSIYCNYNQQLSYTGTINIEDAEVTETITLTEQ